MTRNRSWFFLGMVGILVMGPWARLTGFAQTTDPILRLEAGMHLSVIPRMSMDAENRYLATGSWDKTVRIWDISLEGSPLLLRILRPPSERVEGRILAVALSPDGGTVACGGTIGLSWESTESIFFFDRATGAMTRRLPGLPGAVLDLVYSPDGRFLSAVMAESGFRLFQASDWTLVGEDRDYAGASAATAFDRTGSRVATVCTDGLVRLYDLKGLPGSQDAPALMVPLAKGALSGGKRPASLSFSPDGTRLAVGFEDSPKVEVLDVKGGLKRAFSPDASKVEAGRNLRSVAWSGDGKFLYAGGTNTVGATTRIRKWGDSGRGAYTEILAPQEAISQILPLKAGGVIFASNDPALGICDAQDQLRVLQGPRNANYQRNIEGLLLAADGLSVQFAYEGGGGSPSFFSVRDRILKFPAPAVGTSGTGSGTLHRPLLEGLGITDWRYSFSPKFQGELLPLRTGERSLSIAIAPDRSGFAMGCTTSLRYLDRTGKELWSRPGGPVVAVNTNGKIVLAAFLQGVIRWHRASDGEEILNFFPHADRKRWVLWTPLGYYDASPGAEDFIGWQVNNGKDKEAEFFPASRFRATFYRPDVIDRVLKTMDEKEALRLANEESGRKQEAAVSVRETLPPIASIISPADNAEISSPAVKVRYAARSKDPLTGLRVLVDGRPVAVQPEMKAPKTEGEFTVPIPPADCEVSVIAENRHGAGEPATIRLRWKGAPPPKEEFQIKPKLYVLAVGVSQYQDGELRLDLAAKDALDFGAAWNEQKGRLYSGVEVRVLTDAQATKGKILDGLEWLQRQVTQKDVAVLFFAGHGVNDPNGMFYFLPMEAELDYLKRTGISQADITSTVATIAGKVLVFMDACHSGNLMGKVKRRGPMDISSVINELASAENGAVVFSSATGRQYALENTDWGNGAFTKGLVEGIKGKADFQGTGRITVNMLDLYVSERVKELTQGQQTPTTVKPPNVPDFPVAVLR